MSILIYAESAEGKFKKVAFELASYAKKSSRITRNHGDGSSD
jgi:electron transfer flavoprotein alpha subunit